MLGIKTFTASLLLYAAGHAFAADQAYLPLQPGNSWVFRSSSRLGASPQSIVIESTERFGDAVYTRVSLFEKPIYLRATDSGIAVFNTDSRQEATWLNFGGAVGESVPVAIDACTRSAKVETRSTRVKTAAGEWDNALQLVFEPSCADAGLTTLYFVPGLGPVVFERTSIAGPVRYELVYTRSGSTAAESAQVGFTVALDAPSYKTGDVVDILVRLTLRNTHTEPITLTFMSGQRYDMRIWNDRGEVVYVWSADKLFPQAVTVEQVGSGERTFAFTANVPNLRPGRYVAEAWLATQSREYVGVVGFVVAAQN